MGLLQFLYSTLVEFSKYLFLALQNYFVKAELKSQKGKVADEVSRTTKSADDFLKQYNDYKRDGGTDTTAQPNGKPKV